MKPLLLGLTVLVASFVSPVFAADDATKGKQLGEAVYRAAGGDNWGNVKTIQFSFVVEKEGTTVAKAEHLWNIPEQTDEVKWKGQDVKVNLADPGAAADSKAAYARWVNDSYWLLAPLKLMDKGVTLTAEGTKEISGAQREVLRLSFEQVGLTPTDNYRLYIDPATKMVTFWDYMPKGEKGMSGTWEDYQKSGGLTLATDHKMDGGLRIRIADLKVTTK